MKSQESRGMWHNSANVLLKIVGQTAQYWLHVFVQEKPLPRSPQLRLAMTNAYS
jgi:hypothetical protein